MWESIIVICVGASGGALLRWWFGTRLNAIFPAIPLGTLAANMLGGYVIGAAIAFVPAAVGPEWRLFIMTGFCGGLTTFSTFSAEVTTSILAGQTLWSCAEIMAHVG